MLRNRDVESEDRKEVCVGTNARQEVEMAFAFRHHKLKFYLNNYEINKDIKND